MGSDLTDSQSGSVNLSVVASNFAVQLRSGGGNTLNVRIQIADKLRGSDIRNVVNSARCVDGAQKIVVGTGKIANEKLERLLNMLNQSGTKFHNGVVSRGDSGLDDFIITF